MSKKPVTADVVATTMLADEPTQEAATKTKLQLFAEEVAASHLAIDVEKLATVYPQPDGESTFGYSAVDLVALIEIIGQIVVRIIESCPERSDERIKTAIARPTFWQRVRVKNLAKEFFDNSPRRRWRSDAGAVAEHLIDCAKRAPTDRVQQVLDEVHSQNNWLV